MKIVKIGLFVYRDDERESEREEEWRDKGGEACCKYAEQVKKMNTRTRKNQ
jgi:hypothetical protein